MTKDIEHSSTADMLGLDARRALWHATREVMQ